MTPEQARPGARVRVMEHHRVEERRGLMGTVLALYGGEGYIAVDVRLADGQYRLFWPRDLEEISPPQARWRFLSVGTLGVSSRHLFTQSQRRGVWRTSPVRSSPKLARPGPPP